MEVFFILTSLFKGVIILNYYYIKTSLFFVYYYLNYFFLCLTKRCFGAMKKLIAKTIADVNTMLDPAAILNEYPINNPRTEQHAPIVDDKNIIVFKLLAYKYAVAAGVISIATIRIVPTLCIAVTDTKVKSIISK